MPDSKAHSGLISLSKNKYLFFRENTWIIFSINKKLNFTMIKKYKNDGLYLTKCWGSGIVYEGKYLITFCRYEKNDIQEDLIFIYDIDIFFFFKVIYKNWILKFTIEPEKNK